MPILVVRIKIIGVANSQDIHMEDGVEIADSEDILVKSVLHCTITFSKA
jgi:hypothetical protein